VKHNGLEAKNNLINIQVTISTEMDKYAHLLESVEFSNFLKEFAVCVAQW